MLIAKIDLRPYIKNPSLYITDSLLASLEEELRIYNKPCKKHALNIKNIYRKLKKILKM